MLAFSIKRRTWLRFTKPIFSGPFLSLGIILTSPVTIAASESASASDSSVVQSVPGQRDAVLILAVSPSGSTVYWFRRINLSNGSFDGARSVRLLDDVFGLGDQMKGGDVPGDSSSSAPSSGGAIRLLMASVPAGDYAVTEVYFGNVDLCLNDSAVVVRVPPHKITIVSSGDVAPPGVSVSYPVSANIPVFGRLSTNVDKARIFRAFDSARRYYPNLEGEPANAEIVARIHWEHSGSLFGPGCSGADQFSTIQDTTADTSAARAAALEEAKKNLARANSHEGVADGVEKSASSPPTEKKR